ncbi:hypothetical protein [Nocardia vaccinii]|uniref:hypothetical protein n=1 Tax=Nocardia vaccinii TaxID=1822 RepID=UPI00082C098D|nr:hypothetical protein [Nocardia vaccinii]
MINLTHAGQTIKQESAIPQGDELFTEPACYDPPEDGNKKVKKRSSGEDAQNRSKDEPHRKYSSGEDVQNRSTDEPHRKYNSGEDAQNRSTDAPKKGTAGQDAQNRRW